jgi:signal peptidase I
VFVVVVVVVLRRGLVVVTVRGASMEPTYRDGDRVLVRRRYVPTVGQVVVVERPMHRGDWPAPLAARGVPVSHTEWLIKRVAAIPGDLVPRDRVPALANTPEDRVPPGMLILLGDNREASFDSAHIGYIPANRVLGAVHHDRDAFPAAGLSTSRKHRQPERPR